MYALSTMPTKLQYSSEVGALLKSVIERMAGMDKMLEGWG